MFELAEQVRQFQNALTDFTVRKRGQCVAAEGFLQQPKKNPNEVGIVFLQSDNAKRPVRITTTVNANLTFTRKLHADEPQFDIVSRIGRQARK